MRFGRLVATGGSIAGVGICAVVVIGMVSAAPSAHPDAAIRPLAAATTPSYHDPATQSVDESSSTPESPSFTPSTPASTAVAPTVVATTAPPAVVASTTHAAPRASAAPTTKAAPPPVATGRGLPLTLATGSATEVITVVATASTATTATLQAWTAAPGGGWLPYGPAITAHLGADGIGRASETTSRTPAGSFTLTQAFGHLTNPGTGLPYLQTTPADWWISQPGTLYNTHQHCSANCAFTQGNPNEHLYYETPYYNYAVVIDYNTAPVVQGAGSAFFLHVTDGKPTAGCVAIPQTNLTTIMRWLTPTAHPRILIGVS